MKTARMPRSLRYSPAVARAARKVALAVLCLTMMLTAAFGSGVYWDRMCAQGMPAHARMILPDVTDEDLGRQAMYRMYEDMQASILVLRKNIAQGGWRAKHASNYLDHLRDEVNR